MVSLSKYAKMMQMFKENIKKDFGFDLEHKALTKYTDHGIQFIAEMCLKEISTVISTTKNISLTNMILLRYNLFQLEKHVIKSFIDDEFLYEKGFLDSIVNMKNLLYENILTILNAEIENTLSIFINANFKKKNPIRKNPESFMNIVDPLAVE